MKEDSGMKEMRCHQIIRDEEDSVAENGDEAANPLQLALPL